MKPDRSNSSPRIGISRRQFAKCVSLGAVAVGTGWMTPSAHPSETNAAKQDARIPLKIGHRAASMKMVGDFNVFKLARQMPGVLGVELQIASGKPNLRDCVAGRVKSSQ